MGLRAFTIALVLLPLPAVAQSGLPGTEREPTTGAAAPNSDSTVDLSRFLFAPPPGWVSQFVQGAIVLAPAQFIGESCQIQMRLLHAPAGPLGDLAIDMFRRTFNDDPLQTYPSPAKWLARGISPQGWEYFEIKKLVGGQEGDGRGFGVILLLVRLDDSIATIVGMSKDFMVSRCFGELQGNVWPAFFYSLRFKGVRPTSATQNALRQELAGTWTLATANVGLSYVFAPDGHYQTINLANYSTTNKYSGSGKYSFEGNAIVFVNDDGARKTQSFRLRQVLRNGGGNWEDELCMMEASIGELCYQKGR